MGPDLHDLLVLFVGGAFMVKVEHCSLMLRIPFCLLAMLSHEVCQFNKPKIAGDRECHTKGSWGKGHPAVSRHESTLQLPWLNDSVPSSQVEGGTDRPLPRPRKLTRRLPSLRH